MLGAPPRRGALRQVPEYLQRIMSLPQMDFEYALWQMRQLLVRPSKVYRTTSWHKQTKNQWARDDPAFVLLLVTMMGLASLAFAVAFRADSIVAIVRLFSYTILVDFLLVGLVVATAGWWATNRFMLVHLQHTVEQRVEWLYCLDVHCNAFFPFYALAYVAQYLLLPVLAFGFPERMVCTLLANSLYAGAAVYYIYVTFLGYQALPFVQNVRVFLAPVLLVALAYLALLLLNWNLSVVVMNVYFA